MAKTKSNNRRTKTSTRRKRGGLFGYDVRGKMAKAMGKPEDAFKPDDMGMMAKANTMGSSMKEGAQAMGARAQQMMGPGQAAPAARGGRRRRGSRKTKRSMKSKKSKKSKKSRKTRRGRRRH